MQVERPAASTVKILQLANAADQRIYRADKNNAEHLRSNGLQDYSDDFLQQLVSDSLNHEALYILPQSWGDHPRRMDRLRLRLRAGSTAASK